MTSLSNPFEIARETLRLLASRRIAPTPDNYLTLYHEISGTQPAAEHFPEKQLRSLAAALPRSSPDQLRLARQLDEAIKAGQWDDYRQRLVDFVNGLAEVQKLAWAELISDLFRQWENKHNGLTTARKRDALEHILGSAGINPETLHKRLQNLLRAWGQGRATSDEGDNDVLPEDTPPATPASAPLAASLSAAGGDFAREMRELFAFTLESAITAQLVEHPVLANDARQLGAAIRAASSDAEMQALMTNLKRFAFKLELLAEDQAELRRSLLGLLRLLVKNIDELVLDDRWLHGQVEVIRELIDKPMSQRNIDDAERRLREVLFKQSQLKSSLNDAKQAIKNLLAGFVDQLASFADATSEYHDKIETCAQKVSAANDIRELEDVLGDIMRETRDIQRNTLRSHDQLRATQKQVEVSEARIRELEKELENTSQLVRYDQLTGALNRRGLEEMCQKEMARAERHDSILCVALLDIDNFKKLNDSLGHSAGDQALMHLAAVCRNALRPQDTVARWGGEEFIILLPETPLEEARQALTRLQRELTKQFFLHDNEKVLITFSAGVTPMQPGESQADIIKRADTAMYQAKQSGKNRVVALP